MLKVTEPGPLVLLCTGPKLLVTVCAVAVAGTTQTMSAVNKAAASEAATFANEYLENCFRRNLNIKNCYPL
jgi:hypothetical protein